MHITGNLPITCPTIVMHRNLGMHICRIFQTIHVNKMNYYLLLSWKLLHSAVTFTDASREVNECGHLFVDRGLSSFIALLTRSCVIDTFLSFLQHWIQRPSLSSTDEINEQIQMDSVICHA
jgi:hypothetical protein